MLSDLVVCYLFLGGTGAGLALALSVLGLLVPHACVSTPPGVHLRPNAAYRKLLGSGFAAAFVLLALGIVCLLADLGNAERVILLL
ncbi:MAG: polysulfide reductase, partial [Eggerthella lenta]|nr:polysulfide reductase [Eggerthella lenta]